jgi:hypothetical protein
MIIRRPPSQPQTRRTADTTGRSSPVIYITNPGCRTCATRRPDVSPAQRGGIGGTSLGLMAYPEPKGVWGQEHASQPAAVSRRMERGAGRPA